jgi:hypothetical protein
MRIVLWAPAFLILTAPACVVYTGGHPAPPASPAPNVINAEAGCYWDGAFRDEVWYFEALVSDPNGAYDVAEVWADVYDDGYNGAYVQSFELFPTNDPEVWFSDWLGSTTWVECGYAGYTIDIVAYDRAGNEGAQIVVPYY